MNGKNGTDGTNGIDGTDGQTGATGIAGAGAIVPYSSGSSPISLVVVGGGESLPILVAFGSSLPLTSTLGTSIPVQIVNGYSFIVPRSGTLVGFYATFVATAPYTPFSTGIVLPLQSTPIQVGDVFSNNLTFQPPAGPVPAGTQFVLALSLGSADPSAAPTLDRQPVGRARDLVRRARSRRLERFFRVRLDARQEGDQTQDLRRQCSHTRRIQGDQNDDIDGRVRAAGQSQQIKTKNIFYLPVPTSPSSLATSRRPSTETPSIFATSRAWEYVLDTRTRDGGLWERSRLFLAAEGHTKWQSPTRR
jgi:hypothetical protein